MRALLDRLSARLTALNVPHRLELVPHSPDQNHAALALMERIGRLDRPVVICCDWHLDPESSARLETLHRSGDARVLLVSHDYVHSTLPAVTYQQAGVGSDVARHCLAAGYRRLLFLAPFRSAWSDARAEGILSAARHAGVPVHIEPSVVAPNENSHYQDAANAQDQRLRRALERCLKAWPDADDEFTALIGCTDRVALAVRGIRPDLRVGLAGFDDDGTSARHEMTSARPPADELALRAGEFAARLWRGQTIPTLTELPWDLVVRGSTRRAAASTGVRAQPPTRRLAPSTHPSDVFPTCPPVVLIGWGEHAHLSVDTRAHGERLTRIVRTLTSALAREHLELALLPIDFTGGPEAIRERMERAARRVIRGGAKVVIIQDLQLDAAADGLLTAEHVVGNLDIVHCLCSSVPTEHPVVMHDQGAAGALAAAHCLRQHYRRLLFLAPFASRWSEERGLAARRALLLASAGLSTLLITPEVPELDHAGFANLDRDTRQKIVAQAFDTGCARLTEMVGQATPPAVIAANDDVALLLHAELTARGLRSGIDVGLVGFDDSPEAAVADLTSLVPPLDSMGTEVARIVIRLLAGGSVPRRTCLPWTIATRLSSVQAPPA